MLSELQNQIKEVIGLEDGSFPEIPEKLVPVFRSLLNKLSEENQKRTEAEDMLAFFRASANAMPNPIFIKDEDLRFVFFNRAYREFFCLSEGENIGKRVQDLDYLTKEDRSRYHAEDSELVKSLSVIQYETVFQTEDQKKVESLYWSKGFLVPETGHCGVVGEIVDISKEKETQRELTRSMRTLEILMKDAIDASNIDPLTKLYNRNIMKEEIPLIISKAEAMRRPICIMIIDIDYFKWVNDTYGHAQGDEVLRKFSQLLKQTFRKQDIIVRYGGDEFMVFLPGTGLNQAKAGAEHLEEIVHRKLRLPDGNGITVSIGVTQWHQGDGLSGFLARADEALYLSKKMGRDCVSVK